MLIWLPILFFCNRKGVNHQSKKVEKVRRLCKEKGEEGKRERTMPRFEGLGAGEWYSVSYLSAISIDSSSGGVSK